MAKKWKTDQLWSLAAASLRDACGNDDLAEIWKDSFLPLCSKQEIRNQLETSPARDVARLLLHSFGRGHALIKQAIEWENPQIGRKGSTSTLNITKGIMWRYVVAYCGWDRCTNSLGITQATQEKILAKLAHHLESPKLTDSQTRQILEWIPEEEMLTNEEGDSSFSGRWIREFLGISYKYRDFPNWLLGEESMDQAALLAVLRNIVCHGSLLPSKARNWGLDMVYKKGTIVLAEGFGLVLEKVVPAHATVDMERTGVRKSKQLLVAQ